MPQDLETELKELPNKFNLIHEAMKDRTEDVATPVYKGLVYSAEKLLKQLISVEELKGKEIALMVGLVGSGKSTVCQAIVEGTDSLHYDEDEGVVDVKTPERQAKHHDDRVFVIAHGASTVTTRPEFTVVNDQDTHNRPRYIVDLPGIAVAGSTDAVNSALLTYVLRNAGKVTLVFVFNFPNLQNQRGADFLQLVTHLSRCLNGTAMLDKKRVIPVMHNPSSL